MSRPPKKNFKEAVKSEQESQDRRPQPLYQRSKRSNSVDILTIDLVEMFSQLGLVLNNVPEMAKILVDRGWTKMKQINE